MEYPRDSSPDCYETRNSQHSPNVPGRKSYPGDIAGAFYGSVPQSIQAQVKEVLPPDLWRVTETFCSKYR